ncbi:MAG: hypothetical protein JWP29_2407 [Rhodoferax sp.]|nr:hypothetical protein [Rhodoferax sp.]
MDHPPFDPSAAFDPLLPPTRRAIPPPHGPSPFFDRGGLAWIAVCLAIAALAGRWIPPLSEPGAWGRAATDAGQAVVSLMTIGIPRKDEASSAAAKLAAEKERQRRPQGKLQVGWF